MKPNFFIVGAPKCGTTAWVQYLGAHPDIFFPEIKEPEYFNFDDRPRRRLSRDEYRALYQDVGGKTIIGDGSIGYLNSRKAAKAISRFNPKAKILIFLRQQEDYLPSWHNQLLFNGGENIADFETAWRLSDSRDETNTSKSCWNLRVLNYKAAGLFSEKIERYLAAFGPAQVMVIHFRDWVGDPRETYLGILDFLGLPDDGRTEFPPVNEARHRSTRFFLRIARNPPKVLRVVVDFAKKLSGRQSLGLANWAFSLGARAGYQSSVSAAVKEEIRAYYRAENEQLEPMIWRPDGRQAVR